MSRSDPRAPRSALAESGEEATLHSDVTALLAQAGIVDVDVEDAVADEHVRSAAYRRVVSVVAASRSRDQDREIVALILRDPLELTSKGAVVHLVDEIAPKAAGPDEFQRWAAELLPELDRFKAEGAREFIRRRIHDWVFHLSVRDGHVPAPAELADVTDWMQRTLARNSSSLPVLAVLAESGNTRKIRNIAKDRAGSRNARTKSTGSGG